MSFTPAGTPVTERVEFNAGTIDFGNERIVDIDNISLKVTWTAVKMYVLNSIKIANIARSSEAVQITGRIMSWSPEMEAISWGASLSGTPDEILTLDGQPTLTSPVLTLSDANGKEFQYQVSGALFSSSNGTFNKEAYGEWDFTIDAKDITLVYTA